MSDRWDTRRHQRDGLLLALVAPQVAAFGYLAIAVVVVFRSRGDDTAPTTPDP